MALQFRWAIVQQHRNTTSDFYTQQRTCQKSKQIAAGNIVMKLGMSAFLATNGANGQEHTSHLAGVIANRYIMESLSFSFTPTTKNITAQLRKVLLGSFNDEELEVLCYDYFRLVSDEFTTGMSKSRKVQMLIRFCDMHKRLAHLHAVIHELRPHAFAPTTTTKKPKSVAGKLRPAPAPTRTQKTAVRKPSRPSKKSPPTHRQRSEHWLLRAYAYAQAGKQKPTFAACVRAVLAHPTSAQVHLQVAVLYERFGNVAHALASLTQAIECDDTAWVAYAKRAKLLAQQGKTDAALDDYSDAIALRSDVAEYVFARAQLYEQKLDGRAVADFNRAISLDRNQWTYYWARAMCLHRMGSYARATEDWSRAIALRPNDMALMLSRAHSYYCKADYAHAIADYTAVLAHTPSQADALYWRGMSLKMRGETHWAQLDFQDALKFGQTLAAVELEIALQPQSQRHTTAQNPIVVVTSPKKSFALSIQSLKARCRL